MNLEEIILNIAMSLDSFKQIILVILFGSQAKGTARENSDIDIAFFFDDRYFANINTLEYRLYLMYEFSQILQRDCDIVFLNDVSSLLKYQVFKYGKLLYQREREDYKYFYSKVLREYFDFGYFVDLHYARMLDRIKERN